MTCKSARNLVIQHLGHVLGCRPSAYEVNTILARVAGRTNGSRHLERIIKEETAKFVRAPSLTRRIFNAVNRDCGTVEIQHQ